MSFFFINENNIQFYYFFLLDLHVNKFIVMHLSFLFHWKIAWSFFSCLCKFYSLFFDEMVYWYHVNLILCLKLYCLVLFCFVLYASSRQTCNIWIICCHNKIQEFTYSTITSRNKWQKFTNSEILSVKFNSKNCHSHNL